MKFDFGLVGLGVMGRNFILNVAENGFSSIGLSSSEEKIKLLKEDEIMKLWISKNPPYLPIKIEKNSKNGIIKLLLKKINNDE